MRLSAIGAAVFLAIVVGMGPCSSGAAELKSAPQDKTRMTKAPPSQFSFNGEKIVVMPLGSTRVMGRVRTPKRDLTVFGLNLPSAVRLDDPFRVSFYIRNNGQSTIARASYRMGAVVVIPMVGGEAIGEQVEGEVRNLPAGRDQRIEHTIVLPSSDPNVNAGWPMIVVVVDWDEAIDEENEDNNGIAAVIPGSGGG